LVKRSEKVRLNFVENPSLDPAAVAALRVAVGWDAREEQLEKVMGSTYLSVACFEDDLLVGFVDVLSDGVDDALIRSLMVHSAYQGEGIALELLSIVIDRLKSARIKTINVLFEPELASLYQKAGFRIVSGGLIDTEKEGF
jgi:N-acetylglutamate synthase-like GNAT family acetyltransferase